MPKDIADRIIQLMNDALLRDRSAISDLVSCRVQCNMDLADHPTIQVGTEDNTDGHTVGLLGILNGIAGVRSDSKGYVSAVMGEDGSVKRFERLSQS